MATPSDFGLNGAKPTHPELLDWLAGEFVASGWSMKHIHRLIVLSATYRQSGRAPARLAADAGTACCGGTRRAAWKPSRCATRSSP